MNSVSIPQYQKTVTSLWRLQKIILDTLDFNQVVQKIVDSVALELGFLNIGYRIVVLALVDNEKQILKRISMSQTPMAEAVMGTGKMAFDEIDIPLSAEENFCIKTYFDRQIRVTSDWKDILTPPMAEEESRRLQQVSGIKNSLILPVVEKDKCIGIIIFSLDKDASDISDEEKDLLQSFTEIVGLAIHDAKLYSLLGEANEKLKELDRLKDEFISIASHELRSPAATVKNYLWSVLNDGVNLNEQEKEGIRKAADANDRLIKLVNDLLDVSRIEAGRLMLNPEIFELAGLVAETVEEVKKKTERSGDTIRVETEEIQITADKDKIRQVVINLLENAVKYSMPGKQVEVKVSRKESIARVEVKDQGIGISSDQTGKVFTKFGRLDTTDTAIGKVSGTGLGLYVCKKIIELSGGKIGFDSKPGEGTIFWFEIPIT
jgi:signal transduction histidine kinase